jgi:hypothetical protein
MRSARALGWMTWLGIGLAAGCEAPPEAGYQLADRDFGDFQVLHTVLIRDCGFHTCHGSEERQFRIYGIGRSRLEEDTRAFGENTVDEALLSFDFTLSMIDAEHPERSLLLRKPLAIEAGGSPHDGVDDYGRNVYRTVDDEGYRAIERFVLGENETPDADE